ncbi:long-chain fatty acid--CoA ligase [Gloeocapsopsis crepidinum LEGE 06123]|uniref:Long-chain fatty acid--CoA ligase n=1 Tax=Gloeocapsopsis crepidinum LEGE 06123 TaxID=588587 RepID=A0ABR9UN07_9CHRO|nr:long-chain fatty acid--CoA ligase [Gloeocapsopsis crepidinum LEGE 06123]
MNRPASNMSYNFTEQERYCLKRLIDYSSVQSLPEIWQLAQQRFGNTVALQDPHAVPETVITYTQLYQQIQQFAAALQALQVGEGQNGVPPRIALIADNSPRWFIADQGIIASGAANVVRSSQAERQELLFILENSGSIALVVENQQTLQKLRADLATLPISVIVLLSDEAPEADASLKVLNFPQFMSLGENQPLQPVQQNRETLATLMYTSGTTGKPKGVMLTHGNLLHQVETLGAIVQPQAGDRVLSILPTWHVYERTGEYFLLSQGCTQIYTNIRQVKKDIREFKPNYMVGVPRLWESIYEGVKKQFREQPANKQRLIDFFLSKSQQFVEARRIVHGLSLNSLNPSMSERLSASVQATALSPIHSLGEKIVYQKVREATGGQLKQVISGGGSLAMHLENFFEIIGVEVLVGYGLTETSPVTNARRQWRNLRGASGQPLPGTQVRIVDPETRQPLPQGERGLVMVRGPQIMQGYYQNPEATAKAIDSEGWFDTGDLGWVTPEDDLVITGRAKDTIVLTNGENIEPQPIEDACLRSPYIDQIMLVGQDQKSLGALIVPNLEALQQWAASQNIDTELDLNSKTIQNLFRQELNREVKNRPGYRPDDRIGSFELISEPFSMENGMMTQSFKIKRPVVTEHYRDIINKMFA